MSTAEVGIYVFLLCLDWNETGFVLHPKRLARFCRTTEPEFVEAWDIIRECFVEREGRWYNPRLEREREKQEKFRLKQVAAGQASALARLGQRSTTAEPRFNSPSPSPAPAKTGGRLRVNGSTYAPGHVNLAVPPFCASCGDGVLATVNGQKRPVRVHAHDCPANLAGVA